MSDTASVSSKQKLTEKKEEAAPSVSTFQLFKYANPIELLIIVLAFIASGAVGVGMPITILFLGSILNKVGEALAHPGSISVLDATRPLILDFLYLAVIIFVLSWAGHACWALTGESQAKRIRKLYVRAILRQDIAWFDEGSHGSLTTRLAADTQQIAEGVSHKFGVAVGAITKFVAGFVISFVKGWKLALVTLATLPSMFILAGLVMWATGKSGREAQDLFARAGGIAEQAFGGMKTVHAFNLQKRFSDRYEVPLKDAKKIELRNAIWNGVAAGGFMLLLYSIFGFAFWYGSRLVIKGEMSGGDVLIVFFSLMIGAVDLGDLPPALNAIAGARAAAYRIFETIDRHPPIDSMPQLEGGKDGARPTQEIQGHVEFRNVHFSYPTRKEEPILRGLDLDVRPGTTVAFIGSSGCGKSTALALIQRWYDIDSGALTLDGHSLDSLSLPYLRSQIAIVGQEPALFNLSVRENILMGLPPDVDWESSAQQEKLQAQVEAACREANCHDFIMQLPGGYDANIGEHGGTLSGGQKQRIAIARALIKDPKVLLLDEATSALDTTSERLVIDALERGKRRTIIMVAHRLSTVKNCDVIVYFEKGVVGEIGGHAELVATHGLYWKALEMQKLHEVRDEPTHSDEEDEVMDEKKARRMSLASRRSSVRSKRNSLILGGAEGILAMHESDEELAERVKAPLSTVLKELILVGGDKWTTVFGFLCAMVTGGVNPIFGIIFARVIILMVNNPPDEISPGPLKGANLYAFLHVVIAIVAFFSMGLMTALLARVSTRAVYRARTRMFESMLKQEIGWFDEGRDLIGRLAAEPDKVGGLVTDSIGGLGSMFGAIISGFTIIFIFSWELSLFTLLLLPMFVVGHFYEEYAKGGEGDSKVLKAYSEASIIVTEAVKEIRTVTSLHRQQYFIDRFNVVAREPHRVAQREAILGGLGFSFGQSYPMFSNALGFYVGARMLDDGRITFQNMFAVLMTLTLAGGEIGHSTALASQFSAFKRTAAATLALFQREPEIDVAAPGHAPESIDGSFHFKNVSFHYPTRPNVPIFKGNFNLTGERNKTIALVGPSGCGKSTIIGMLERWYECDRGTVDVDGTDVKNYQLRNLRTHMALVGQEPILFDMTIRENLLWGTEREVSQAELDEVTKRANAYNFIHDLTNGYDTRVGDKGSQLSGGQKQRIAIARALIRRPRILLLDEATSALDSESESVVQAALDEASQTQTTVTIAHRLSTIQNADVIVVIKGGRVIQMGTHDELMRHKDGLYAELAAQQS